MLPEVTALRKSVLKKRNGKSFNLVRPNQELKDTFFKCISVFFLLWIGVSQFSFAEGSKDLITTGGGVGHRAFLLSTTITSTNSPFPTLGTVKVYVRAGESIYLGSSAQQIGNGRMNVRAPGGATYTSAALAAGIGLITNKNQEDAGPLPNAGGYTPWILPVGVAQEGVWEIDFISPDVGAGQNANALRTNANAAWVQANSTPLIAAFDVSVRNSANTAFINGRAFMNIFVGSLGDFDANFTGKFKILTKDGYQYDVDNNGQSGFVFSFFANNKGFKDNAGNPIYRSINTLSGTVPVQDPRAVDTGTDITHKIFFNTPDASMPTTAATPSGSTWLYTTPTSPQAANFLFEGKEGTQNQAGTAPLGANLTFETNQTGSYIIDMDINQNGVFNDAIDRRLTGVATSGTNTIYWDGLNGLGAKVQGNFTFSPSNLNLSLVGGEVHFPFLDVENNINGIIIRRLNGVNAPNDIVYWNDTDISSTTNPSNPRNTSVSGISSTTNGHKWGSNAYSGTAFGNEVGLDTWTYVISNTVLPFMNITLKEADLEVVSITPTKTSYCVGENISYVVRVRNNGPDAVSGAKFAFNYPTQFTVSGTSSAVTTGTATISSSATIAGQYTATLDMSNNAVISFTINGTLNNYPGGTLNTSASILRPVDVTDPDATNEDALPPTDPLIECNAGTVGCNNIKEDTSVTINVRTISVASAIVAEGTGGTRNLSFPVSLSAVSACDISVDYSITYNTTQASDFAGVTNGTITIPAGSTSANILIPIATDNIIEANETFTLTLANPTGGNTIFMGTATGTINNDDNAQITITKIDGNEENAIPARFIFSFPPGVFADANTEVQYELSGTAIGNGPDYPEALTGSVIIPAGQQSATLNLNTVNDDIVEGTETVIIDILRINSPYSLPLGTNITLNPIVPTLNIFDNDVATLTISNPITLVEGNSGTTAFNYTVTLNKATSSSFTVNYNTSNNTATIADNDYVTSSGTLTFNGNLNEVQNITVLVNGDQKLEANETFNVLLASLNNNFGGRLTIPSPNTSGTIINDDAANITITKVDGVEGGQNVRFVFTLDNGKTADQNLSIPYSLLGSALANGTDYLGAAVGNVILPAGQNSTFLELFIVDDQIVEGNEDLTLSTGAIANPYGITVTNSPQTVTITDNDNANISISNVTETEGNNGNKIFSFNVTLNNAVKESFSINYFTNNGTALAGEDYQAVASGNLGFSGNAGEVRTISITVNGDEKIEANEFFNVTLQNLSKNFNNHLTIGNASATGSIMNDDTSTIQISSSNGNETGQLAGTFTFSFTTGFTVDRPTEISYTLAGSATTSADYIGVTSGTITIPAGQNSATLTLPVLDDNTVEGTETIILSSSLVNSPYAISVSNSPQSLNILDNDTGTLTLIGPPDVTEGADATSKLVQFQVQLSKATERPFAVDYDTNNLSATSGEDYITENGSLSFSGILNEIRTISVTINGDAKIEADELFNLALSNLSENFGGLLTLANASATAKILNDDAANISITAINGAEGGANGAFRFSFPANVTSDQNTIINYILSGVATSADYVANPSPVNITIPAGQNSIQLNIDVIDDILVEGNEQLQLSAVGVSSAYPISLMNNTASLSISDNDSAQILVTAPPASLEGNFGSNTQIFTLRLTAATAQPFSIPYQTVNISANAGEDYVLNAGTINFNGLLNEEQTVEIVINGDTKVEPDEQYNLVLGNVSNHFQNRLSIPVNSSTASILNDDGGVIRMRVANGSEDGVDGKIRFEFLNGATAAQPIILNYNLVGTALATGVNADYSANFPSTITIPAGASFAEVTLNIVNDAQVENTETVEVLGLVLGSVYPGISIDAARPILNIADNDQAELVLSGPPSVLEGDTGFTTLTYTVKLTKATATGFNINYGTQDNGATTANADYIASSGTLNFTGLADETKTFDVIINGDNDIELNELFNIRLFGLDNNFNNLLVVQGSPFAVNILNDDNDNINITKLNAEEGVNNGSFIFSLPVGVVASENLTIDYVIDGTALAGTDHQTLSGFIILPAGSNAVSLPIAVNDDLIVEGTETVRITATVRPNTLSITINNPQESINIRDNDEAILTVNELSQPELNSGTSNMLFTVKLDKQTALPFTLAYASADVTASAGEDYQAIPAGALLSFNGTANEEATISIPINGDNKIEADEVFNIILGALSNQFEGRLTIPAHIVNATIENDDAATISIIKQDGKEGVNNAQFIFSFPSGFSSDKETIINFSLGGTANGAGLDYIANPSATAITIPANTTSATLTLNVNDDEIIEFTENVSLSSVTINSTYNGITLNPLLPTLQIEDNDIAQLALTGSTSVNEGDNGTTAVTYTLTLNKATTSPFRVDYQTTGNSATLADQDYLDLSGFVDFFGLAGETKTFTLFVRGDRKIEADESLFIQVNAPNINFDNRLSIQGSPLALQILNDDLGNITITKEDGEEGVKDAVFRFSLPPDITADQPITINYILSGTATQVLDFDALSSSITLNAGANSVVLPVQIIDDAIVEDIETLVLSAALPVNVYGVTLTNASQNVQILDNDIARLSLIGPVPTNEGNSVLSPLVFSVSLDKQVAKPFTINYQTINGTASVTDQDYNPTTGILSFNGNAGETINFTVDVRGDRKIEADETFSILLDSLSENFNNRLTITNPSVTATINNDDSGDIILSSLNGKEAGAQKGQFIFSLPTGITVDKPIQINYILTGAAWAGSDYNNAASGTVTIPAHTNSAVLDIQVIDDTLLEENETVILSVTSVVNDYNLQMRSSIDTLSIEDNDISTLTLNGPLSITEGNSGTKTLTFEVKLDKAVASNFTVYYRTQDATASSTTNDYQSTNGTLSFAGLANETKSVSVTINGDTRVEGTEFFELWLENLSLSFDGRLRIAASPSRGIILDDDNNTLNKTLSITKIDGEEGTNNASFNIAFPSGVTLDTDTEIFYTLGGTTIINQDFQTATTGSLIIPAGQNSVTLNLNVTDDAIVEDIETVSLITANINNSNYQDIVVANSPITLQIKDNDEATLTLQAAQIAEGDNGVTQINFDVVLNKQTSRGFDVSYRTTDATATVADQDYIAKAETIAFAGTANERKTITININGDINIERNEQFNLILEPLIDNFNNRLSIPINTVTGTILNDDDAQVSITKTDGAEGGAQVSFIFSLPPNVVTDEPIQIDYQLMGTALAAGVDYTGANLGSITILPYQNSATLNLPVVDDSLIEADETLSISVSALNTVYSSAITLNPLIPTAIIRDNDEATLSISGPISVSEGNTGTTALTFIVGLDKNTGRNFSINFTTADGSATVAANDYIPRNGTLNFAGNASESYPITILVNGDRNIEQTEDFFLNLIGLSDNFNNRLKLAGLPARGVILDDDNIPANRNIMITALNGSESGTDVRFRFSFPPQVVSDVATTIPYALTGTAIAADFTGALAGTVTIPAGQNSVLLSLPVVNDEIIEGKETLILTSGAVINNSFNGITVVNSPAQAEIEDNDTGVLSIQNIELDEGNLGTSEAVFTVSLNKQTSLPFTLSYSSADVTATTADADYVPINAQLSFTGNANEARNIRVLVNGDRKLEADEILRVALGAISNTFEGRLTLQNSSATATIKNDDSAQITVTGVNGAEAGQQAARFIFSFPAGVTADIPTVINYTLAGTATAGDTDYKGSINGVIAIPAGAERVILDLPVLDDDIIEEDETITIAINSINSNYSSSISFNPVLPTLRIIDNDVATLRISDAIRINEGNNGTTPFNFTVTLDKATGNNFTLNYATQDGSATTTDNDYNTANGVLSFAGTTGETRTVTVFVNSDLKLEGNENFNFIISGLSNNFNNRLSIPVNSSMGTILNDDDGIITISKIDGTEGLQDARFIFSLPPGVNSDQPINITYRLAGTAGSSDYTANPASGSMVIPAGQNSVALQLAVADDLVLEETETVTLNNIQIANAYNNVSLAQPVPIINIFDNDVANLTITAPAPTLEGNLGQKSFNFNITLDKATDRSFTLDYNTYDISATTANRDYESRTGRVSFAGFAGETKTIAVPVIGDIELENNETFGFRIFGLSTDFAGKMILGNDANAIIQNDDIGPVANDDRVSTLEDTPITFSVTDNDFHADGINTGSVNMVSNPQKGKVQMMQNGKAIYTPSLNEFGFDSFTYTVRDALGRLSNIATVSITIVAVNDAPIALNDEFYVKKDSTIRASVSLNDSDPDQDPLRFRVLQSTSKGSLAQFDESDGSFIYIPNRNFKGTDRFTYILTDPSGLRDTATATLFVQPVVTVSLTPSVSLLNEGDTLIVTAKLTESLFQDVNFVLNFAGTATQDKDYALSGNFDTMMIPAGDTITTQKFSLIALKDFLKEGQESVEISIAAPDPAAFVRIGTGTDVIITDFYPEDKPIGPEENGEINPDPYMSPNGDGLGNEKFIIYNIERFPDNEVIIYNRWGNEVYKTKGYNNKDNAFAGFSNIGILANSQSPVVDGVYFFMIYTKSSDGKQKANKGYVIIRR
jgi:hypothetical protein